MRSNRIPLALLALAVLLGGCASTGTDHLTKDAPRAQRFEGLGPHGRAITTTSPEAQSWFDQGVAWMYAFNHDEAIRSFARAAEVDPDCAAAWWAIALCEGPNYNDPEMTPERNAAAWGALQEALARREHASPIERELIDALEQRYAKPAPEDRSALDRAYAEAMAKVWERHPHDADVAVLYAESMMVQRPWKLWSKDGQPEGDTPRIVATLERAMQLDPENPGAYHLFIHAVEPSANPEQGLDAARRLESLVPTAGHLDHMPSHIYVQTGHWEDSIECNRRAMAADAKYRERSPDQGIQHMYMVHNAHMLAYSAMMVGREQEAMDAARSMWRDVPEEMIPIAAPFIDLWMTSVYDVQKRFGRWDAILAEPAPPETLPITCAVWHAHRAIAFAAKQDFTAAEREHAHFREAKAAIPEDNVFGIDSTHAILEVADHFVAGELALQRADWNGAIAHLREAVTAEDALGYGEPPQYLQPSRHTLGAVLLEAGRAVEAERVYREDLAHWPENGWSLYGLYRALLAQGEDDEAAEVKARYDRVWARADEPTTTSCKCLPDAGAERAARP